MNNMTDGARNIYGSLTSSVKEEKSNPESFSKGFFVNHRPEKAILGLFLLVAPALVLRSQNNPVGISPVAFTTLTDSQSAEVAVDNSNPLTTGVVNAFTATDLFENLVSPGAPRGSVPQSAVEGLLQTMLNSFQQASSTDPISGIKQPMVAQGFPLVTAAGLLDPQQGLQLQSIIMRLDLQTAATCGEVRAIFALPIRSPLNGASGHFLVIAEGAERRQSEDPSCSVIQGFAKNLPTWTTEQQVAAFNQLFLTGYTATVTTAHSGLLQFPPVPSTFQITMPPLWTPSQLGANGFGQIRFNGIPDTPPIGSGQTLTPQWEERQYAVISQNGTNSLVDMPLNSVPYPQLYGDPQSGEDPGITSQRPIFQNNLVNNIIPNLVQNTDSLQYLFKLISSQTCAPGQCAYQSLEGTGGLNGNFPDNVALIISPTFSNRINANVPPAWASTTVTSTPLLNALSSTTCFGCHEGMNDNNIAPTPAGGSLIQPTSNGFTHIDENGSKSSYVLTVLPFRYSNLNPAPVTPVTPGPSGSGSGSGNGNGSSGNSGTVVSGNSFMIHSGTVNPPSFAPVHPGTVNFRNPDGSFNEVVFNKTVAEYTKRLPKAGTPDTEQLQKNIITRYLAKQGLN